VLGGRLASVDAWLPIVIAVVIATIMDVLNRVVVLFSNLGLHTGYPECIRRFIQSLKAYSGTVPRFDHERFLPNPSQFTTHSTI
jgi:hypothetical protein